MLRMSIILVLFLTLDILSAVDVALPEAVISAKKDYELSVQRAEQDRNKAVEAARAQLKAVLEAEKVKATKSGNLDLALKIREMIEVKTGSTQTDSPEELIGDALVMPKKNVINIEQAKELARRYAEVKQADWEKMGGVLWTVSATSVFESKLAIDGTTIFLAPSPTDVWRRGPTDDPQPWNGKGDMVMMWSAMPDRSIKAALVDGLLLNQDRKLNGKLQLFVMDEGRSDNSGSVRVKVFMVK